MSLNIKKFPIIIIFFTFLLTKNTTFAQSPSPNSTSATIKLFIKLESVTNSDMPITLSDIQITFRGHFDPAFLHGTQVNFIKQSFSNIFESDPFTISSDQYDFSEGVDFHIVIPGFLTKKGAIKPVLVNQLNILNITEPFRAGNFLEPWRDWEIIDATDMQDSLMAYGNTGANKDINKDGTSNLLDIVYAIKNFGYKNNIKHPPMIPNKTTNILLIEFAEPGTIYQTHQNYPDLQFLSLVNNPTGETVKVTEYGTLKFKSLYFLKQFFEREALKRNANLNLNLSVLGPYEVTGMNYFGFTINDSIKHFLYHFFLGKMEELNIDYQSYDLVGILFFDDHGLALDHDTAFQSFAQRWDGIAFIDFDTYIDYGVQLQTLLHETGHLFNGDDLYQGWGCQIPQGIPEPNKIPLYPQNKACLMCGFIQISETQAQGFDINNESDKLVICDYTASKYNW